MISHFCLLCRDVVCADKNCVVCRIINRRVKFLDWLGGYLESMVMSEVVPGPNLNAIAEESGSAA